MIDKYLNGNKFKTTKPINIICEPYLLIGKQSKVNITIHKEIEVLNIGRKSLIFLHENYEYIYHDTNIDHFIESTFEMI